MTQHRLTTSRWKAIENDDSDYDDKFVYGIKNTKIFCVPSCKCKVNKNQIELFMNAEEAKENGYLACKKCKPFGEKISLKTWITEINTILKLNYDNENLNLDLIASFAHGAPYYLHHKYKEVTNITPLEKLTEIRIKNSKQLLKASVISIPEVAQEVGMKNAAYFSTFFKKEVGQTPLKYRKSHPNNQLSELLKNISINLQNT